MAVKTANTSTKTDEAPPSWGITELAEQFQITTRAIRFYEDKHLLAPKRIGKSRVFCQTDRDRLEKILRAKRIGFSLEDIKQFLDVADGVVTDQDELVQRKNSFEAVIGRLHRKRQDIDVISKDMQTLCALIDDYLKTAPQTGVFQFAAAYDAKFREHLDEDFMPI